MPSRGYAQPNAEGADEGSDLLGRSLVLDPDVEEGVHPDPQSRSRRDSLYFGNILLSIAGGSATSNSHGSELEGAEQRSMA